MPPSRDFQLHDASPLLRDGGRRVYDVLRPSYDGQQLSLTWRFLQFLGYRRATVKDEPGAVKTTQELSWFRAIVVIVASKCFEN